MFRKRQRCVMVKYNFSHGTDKIEPMEIRLADGEKFYEEIGSDKIRKDGRVVKSIDVRAGYTVIREFFYQ